MDVAACGCVAEPFMEMLGIDLKKLKPSFGGRGKNSKSSNSRSFGKEENDDDDVNDNGATAEEPTTESPQPTDSNDWLGENTNAMENNQDDDDKAEDSDGEAIGAKEEGNNNNQETDEEDVQEMLDNLEIPDFSFSHESDVDSPKEAAAAATVEDENNIDCAERMKREEIYSKRYRPSKAEEKELKDLATKLGVSSSGFRLSSSASALHELLFGNHSIILKKGPISSKDQNCDLYILTDGFILAYQSVSAFNPLGSRYEACHLWVDVDHVDLAKAGTLHLQMTSGESYDLFAVSDGENVRAWCHVIEKVAIQRLMHDQNQSSERTVIFGWQHAVVHCPGFTAAVLGDMKLMGNPRNLNDLDVYNKSAPLHYALHHDPVDKAMVEALLRLGADPNIPDGEGRSAMYFAQRNNLDDDVVSMLQEHGGEDSKLAEVELRGELFSRVEQSTQNSEKRRENEKAVEAAAKAKAAQSQMSQNMAAMIERGEKIEEMDEKARELNEQAKEFGSMAAELKKQMKNKKWYQL